MKLLTLNTHSLIEPAYEAKRDAPDAAAKKRIDQIWCSQTVPVHSSRVVFGGKQEPRVSDHAGVLIEVER